MEANRILSTEKIDLMFLDIQMPRMRGTDFLRNLEVKPKVIITSAYTDFALEGFELNVLDYLLKPITPERFLKAINRAREVLSTEGAYFFIRAGNKISFIPVGYQLCTMVAFHHTLAKGELLGQGCGIDIS